MSKVLSISIAVVLLAGGVAWADWDPGDPYKMHFPQLPDPLGWDVAFSSSGAGNGSLADDWECSETGPVDDIHFWISVEKSASGVPPPALADFRVSIRADVPAGTIAGVDYSTPTSGAPLWTKNIDTADASSYKIRSYGTGTQGWYNPWTGIATPDDHYDFYQINLTNLGTADEPAFNQTQGTIYWLEIGMLDVYDIGWKTADLSSCPASQGGDHFMDDAVYSPGPNTNTIWQDLYYPNVSPPKSLDLAFVITPEPATMLVLALGMVPAVLGRARARRN